MAECVLDLVSAGVDHVLPVGPREPHEDAALQPVLAVQDDGLAVVRLLDLKPDTKTSVILFGDWAIVEYMSV